LLVWPAVRDADEQSWKAGAVMAGRAERACLARAFDRGVDDFGDRLVVYQDHGF
jgi:hypothetical protein